MADYATLIRPTSPRACSRPDPMQAVGSILAGEEDDIGVGRCLAGMHDVGGNIEHRARPRLHLLTAYTRPERAFEDVDPLLIGMRVRFGARAGGHPHQSYDHPFTFDAGAI